MNDVFNPQWYILSLVLNNYNESVCINLPIGTLQIFIILKKVHWPEKDSPEMTTKFSSRELSTNLLKICTYAQLALVLLNSIKL